MSRSRPAKSREIYERVVHAQGERAGLGAPLRDAFYRTEGPQGRVRYPLAELVNSRTGAAGGGRGGRTRTLLYLSLLWVAGGGDHGSTRPAWFWAALLGLPDPRGLGARTIGSAWRDLADRRLVALTPAKTSGDPPRIQLLREDGIGAPYSIPTGRHGDTYRRIPQACWAHLFWSPELTGPGLSLYLVALRTFGQSRGAVPLTFSRQHFHSEYGMSDSTRKAGLRNLTGLSVLEREGVSQEYDGIGPRRRGLNRYWLADTYQPRTPSQAIQAPSPPKSPTVFEL